MNSRELLRALDIDVWHPRERGQVNKDRETSQPVAQPSESSPSVVDRTDQATKQTEKITNGPRTNSGSTFSLSLESIVADGKAMFVFEHGSTVTPLNHDILQVLQGVKVEQTEESGFTWPPSTMAQDELASVGEEQACQAAKSWLKYTYPSLKVVCAQSSRLAEFLRSCLPDGITLLTVPAGELDAQHKRDLWRSIPTLKS